MAKKRNVDEQLLRIFEYVKVTADMAGQIAAPEHAGTIETVKAVNEVAYKIVKKDPTAMENPRFAEMVKNHTTSEFYDMINDNYKKSIAR